MFHRIIYSIVSSSLKIGHRILIWQCFKIETTLDRRGVRCAVKKVAALSSSVNKYRNDYFMALYLIKAHHFVLFLIVWNDSWRLPVWIKINEIINKSTMKFQLSSWRCWALFFSSRPLSTITKWDLTREQNLCERVT